MKSIFENQIMKDTVNCRFTGRFVFSVIVQAILSFNILAGQEAVYRDPSQPVGKRVEDLLSRMTLEEKLGQLNMPNNELLANDLEGKISVCEKFAAGNLVQGIGPAGGFWAPMLMFAEGAGPQAEFVNSLQKIAREQTRLGIPLLFMAEGTHGVLTPGATVFPEGLALGSTWNPDLFKQVYAAVGKEGRTRGIHFLGTLVVEPFRDPRMGRNEEGYSEDPYMCSRYAEAIVNGMQGTDLRSGENTISLLCHFPGQSEPVSGLERGAMEMSERKLREIYLPSWMAGIKKAGALGVMATYPSIDGLPAHGSEKLLTRLLREELGFDGLVFSEGAGIGILVYEKIVADMKEAGVRCLKSGVDVSIWNEDGYMNALKESLREGKISVDVVDRSVRRILKIKFMLGLFEKPYVDAAKAVRESNTVEARSLALQAAREGIVLLKNEKDLLPLDKKIRSIAVIGPNADAGRNQLGDYIARTLNQHVVTVLEGIRNKVGPGTKISYVKGCDITGKEHNELSKAREAARKADVAIVVLGENGEITNGEGHDVASLDLTGMQEELLKAVYSTGTPVIAVLISGRPLSVVWASENIPAMVQAWMCGEEGGNAVADVLFGDYNPDGRLPVTFARHSGQLPVYYNHMQSKDFWVKGYGFQYVDMSASPLYNFGFGLSYTTFDYSGLVIDPQLTGTSGDIKVSAVITNSGKREGGEVVQLYIEDMISSLSTPVMKLTGFEKIRLKAGESSRVTFRISPDQLSFYNQNLEKVVEPGMFRVMVGGSSDRISLTGEFELQ
jgi:beta-glucosidase